MIEYIIYYLGIDEIIYRYDERRFYEIIRILRFGIREEKWIGYGMGISYKNRQNFIKKLLYLFSLIIHIYDQTCKSYKRQAPADKYHKSVFPISHRFFSVFHIHKPRDDQSHNPSTEPSKKMKHNFHIREKYSKNQSCTYNC